MVSLEVLNNTVTTIELIPYVQCLDTVGVQLLHGKAATEFLQEILAIHAYPRSDCHHASLAEFL
jgi:hypothetical protein